jgi:alpha-tubulin suppressor-like RCC1 family protein
MSSNQNITTNFKDSDGVDLGSKLVRKDYLLSVYPSLSDKIDIPPELWTWGLGTNGRLGNAVTTGDRSTPVTTFAGGTNWKQVSFKSNHTAAIKTDGTLWTWGSGTNGQLGNAVTADRSTPVTTFSGGTNWKQVSCGYRCTSAIKTDGTLWTWGSGLYGQLGNGVTTGNRSTPVTTFSGGTNWKQVSCVGSYTAAIKTDGTLWTWGSGTNGKLGNGVTTGNISTPVTTFAGGTDWKQVSSGGSYIAAIKTDGTLWTWGFGSKGRLGSFIFGSNRSTPVTTFAGGTNWSDVASTEPEDLYTISAGGAHTAAIKTDGTLWTWGFGTNGKLGNGVTTGSISTPVTTFAGGTNWKQVSCARIHNAAIKTDGTLWTWGAGNRGQLGNGVTAGTISTPVTTFAGGTDWKQVSCGDSFTSAIKTDGTLWTWGYGFSGQLGNGVNSSGNISTPVTTFSGGTNWKQVSCGYRYASAIKTDGTLWVWGSGLGGQLGNAVSVNRSTPVTTFAGGTDWKQVSCGYNNTSAIKTDGTLWTWGSGPFGGLGNGVTNLGSSTPITTFAGGTNWKQVSCGYFRNSAIKTDGTLWTWGRGDVGQLGNGVTNLNVSTPVTTFAGGTNWKQVSSGDAHTVALIDAGGNKELYLFGDNSVGQLGNALVISMELRSTPITTFSGGTNWKQVSCGYDHTSAIKTDGTLWTWGYGLYGNLGNALTTDIFTPVTTFSGGTNWKQVSSGGRNTAAIKTDGTLWTWGRGTNGQLGNAVLANRSTPVTTFLGGTNWKQVDYSNDRSCAAIRSVDFTSF